MLIQYLQVDMQKRNGRTDITATMDRAFQMDLQTIQMVSIYAFVS